MSEDCGYIAFYKGKQIEVWAPTSFAAHAKAVAQFKARKGWEVRVYLCERTDGSEVVHVAVD